jgi:hypothetical protein
LSPDDEGLLPHAIKEKAHNGTKIALKGALRLIGVWIFISPRS